MKTKGALIWEFNQPWSIEEIEIGDPVRDEVKIQMEASGMCHSDHHLVTGGIPMGGFPVLGGHEGAGIVTEVGPGRRGHRARRPRGAVVHPVLRRVSVVSGRSAQPVRPGRAAAQRYRRLRRHLPDPGQGRTPVFPMTLLGTFSPYMVVHKSSVVKIDPSIPFEVACLVGCGVTTGYGSATRSADIRPGRGRRRRRRRRRGHVGAAGRRRSRVRATSSSSSRSSGSAMQR